MASVTQLPQNNHPGQQYTTPQVNPYTSYISSSSPPGLIPVHPPPPLSSTAPSTINQSTGVSAQSPPLEGLAAVPVARATSCQLEQPKPQPSLASQSALLRDPSPQQPLPISPPSQNQTLTPASSVSNQPSSSTASLHSQQTSPPQGLASSPFQSPGPFQTQASSIGAAQGQYYLLPDGRHASLSSAVPPQSSLSVTLPQSQPYSQDVGGHADNGISSHGYTTASGLGPHVRAWSVSEGQIQPAVPGQVAHHNAPATSSNIHPGGMSEGYASQLRNSSVPTNVYNPSTGHYQTQVTGSSPSPGAAPPQLLQQPAPSVNVGVQYFTQDPTTGALTPVQPILAPDGSLVMPVDPQTGEMPRLYQTVSAPGQMQYGVSARATLKKLNPVPRVQKFFHGHDGRKYFALASAQVAGSLVGVNTNLTTAYKNYQDQKERKRAHNGHVGGHTNSAVPMYGHPNQEQAYPQPGNGQPNVQGHDITQQSVNQQNLYPSCNQHTVVQQPQPYQYQNSQAHPGQRGMQVTQHQQPFAQQNQHPNLQYSAPQQTMQPQIPVNQPLQNSNQIQPQFAPVFQQPMQLVPQANPAQRGFGAPNPGNGGQQRIARKPGNIVQNAPSQQLPNGSVPLAGHQPGAYQTTPPYNPMQGNQTAVRSPQPYPNQNASPGPQQRGIAPQVIQQATGGQHPGAMPSAVRGFQPHVTPVGHMGPANPKPSMTEEALMQQMALMQQQLHELRNNRIPSQPQINLSYHAAPEPATDPYGAATEGQGDSVPYDSVQNESQDQSQDPTALASSLAGLSVSDSTPPPPQDSSDMPSNTVADTNASYSPPDGGTDDQGALSRDMDNSADYASQQGGDQTPQDYTTPSTPPNDAADQGVGYGSIYAQPALDTNAQYGIPEQSFGDGSAAYGGGDYGQVYDDGYAAGASDGANAAPDNYAYVDDDYGGYDSSGDAYDGQGYGYDASSYAAADDQASMMADNYYLAAMTNEISSEACLTSIDDSVLS